MPLLALILKALIAIMFYTCAQQLKRGAMIKPMIKPQHRRW